MRFVPFPGPSSSGDQVLGKCTVPGGPCILIASPVLAACSHGCAGRAPPQVCHVSPLGSWSQAASPLADVNCPGSQEDVGATESLLTFWWRMLVSGAEIGAALCLPALAVTHLPCCFQWRGGASTQQTSSPLVFAQSFVLRPGWELEPFMEKFSLFFFFPSLVIPQFGMLSHVSSLRLSLGYSGLVLTLRTDPVACASLSSPRLLVADASLWATSPLAVAVRRLFCGFCLFVFSTDLPLRGFPTVWKLLFHDSLPRMGLHP